MVSSSLVIVSVVVALVLFIWSRRSSKIKFDDAPPMVPGALPFIGHLPWLLRDPLTFLQKAKEKYGGLVTVNLLGGEVVFVLSREYASPFFATGEDKLSFYKVAGESSVIIADMPHEHETFEITKKASTYQYEDVIASVFKEALDELPQSGTLDLFDWSRRVICKVTMKAFVGIPVSDKLVKDILDYEHAVITYLTVRRVIPQFISNLYLKPDSFRRREAVLRDLEPIVATVLNEQDEEKMTPFFKMHVAASLRKLGRPITVREMSKQVVQMAFAAVTNSSNAVAEAILRAAQNPDLAKDLMSVWDTPQGNEALLAWSLECARLSASATTTFRVCMDDDVFLGKYYIPKDTMVFASGVVMSLDNNVFQQPDHFDPKRFLPDNAKKGSVPSSHPVINWGGGMHLCPGKRFALGEVKGGMKAVLNRLDITPLRVESHDRSFNANPWAKRKGACLVQYIKKN
eukprot:TRINITY_DN8782_c0_g1_i2.p1 TRINITY_DN8782_c0_g1~~TRINITY_DN8782_c0_g1_i2.p1  ORF type:complete len:459 (-),score=82.75 TRINITY_DN8782_c0_g1_i2:16-1392(-)